MRFINTLQFVIQRIQRPRRHKNAMRKLADINNNKHNGDMDGNVYIKVSARLFEFAKIRSVRLFQKAHEMALFPEMYSYFPDKDFSGGCIFVQIRLKIRIKYLSSQISFPKIKIPPCTYLDNIFKNSIFCFFLFSFGCFISRYTL